MGLSGRELSNTDRCMTFTHLVCLKVMDESPSSEVDRAEMGGVGNRLTK